MKENVQLSDHCIVDHFEKVGIPEYDRIPGHSPIWLLRGLLLNLDRKMHFTGLRGGIWRLIGVDRSVKNLLISHI